MCEQPSTRGANPLGRKGGEGGGGGRDTGGMLSKISTYFFFFGGGGSLPFLFFWGEGVGRPLPPVLLSLNTESPRKINNFT